jgi:glucan phosphoethanolaminetransferase (alkaline phosphatase superfamily)
VIITGYAVDQVFFGITDSHLDLAGVKIIWRESGMALDAYSVFMPYFVRDYLWVIGVGIILGLTPVRTWSLKLRWSAVPICALALTSIVIPYTKGGTQAFAPPFTLPVMLGMVATATVPEFAGNLSAKIEYENPIRPLAKHVVFIVDESVRGDVIEINQPAVENTPFLASQKDKIINFGVAVAASNCSYQARTMIRFGLRPEDFQKTDLNALQRPPIWKYARRAGYRTILIEARPYEKPFYVLDLPLIDRFLPEGNVSTFMRDGLIAQELIQLLKEDVPSFIYVNKFGTHFPYESAYPPDFDKFLVPGQHRTVGYRRIDTYGSSAADNREALLNQYNNAILWSVDGFFQKLLTQFDDGEVLLIYTSDHGQSLMDGGQKRSHCSAQNTQRGEGLVPLFAATRIPGLAERLHESATLAYGYASHFEIFPTLLLAMGFDEKWIEKKYGPSLLEVPANRRRMFLITDGITDNEKWLGNVRWVPVD